MALNEAAGFVRSKSNLTKEQKRQAEMVIYGLQEADMQNQDQGKIQEVDLNRPPQAPYVYREFPRLMYNHATRKTRVAHNAEEVRAALEAGWKKEPFGAAGAEQELDTEGAAEASAAEASAVEEALAAARRRGKKKE